MVTINIKEFEGYDIDEFIDFLSAQNETNYEVVLPKETTMFYTSNNEIAFEFAIASYVGQKLSEISDEFSYTPAPLNIPGEFIFYFKANNVNELAEFLFEVSSVFGNSEVRESLDFTSEVFGFIEDFKGKKVVCQDLFDTALEYHTEEKNNEDEE